MRKYIFLTIIKRFLLGFSMSYFNENENVALILLSISFCFALYSISNLPFAEVYHNYRSNFCHITELTIIFAAYYYRRVGKKDVNNESIS
jgi:succinate dehydrogenase hydrophobic anchor subunit